MTPVHPQKPPRLLRYAEALLHVADQEEQRELHSDFDFQVIPAESDTDHTARSNAYASTIFAIRKARLIASL
jgi:hypothetical protein